MLNLTTKKNFLKSKKSNNGDLEFNRLKISDVERFYTNKNHNNFLYGLEYERLSLDKNTLRNASYSKIEKIIKDFCSILNWDVIYDDETVIAARDKNS